MSTALPPFSYHHWFDASIQEVVRLFESCENFRALERQPNFQHYRLRIERAASTLVHRAKHRTPPRVREALRVVHWNIERGKRLDEIKRALSDHSYMRQADVLILTEADIGMARSGNRHTVEEIAAQLGYEYVYANAYLCVTKGTREELEIEGENLLGMHGLGILTRYPILESHVVPLPAFLDKFSGHEKRFGQMRALVSILELPRGKRLAIVGVHLDSQSSPSQRRTQMKAVLEGVEDFVPRGVPILIGGDLNTSTYSVFNAQGMIPSSLLHLVRGIRHSIEYDYAYPDRFYEKLFHETRRYGYRFENFNELGAGTIVYDQNDSDGMAKVLEQVPRFVYDWLYRKLEPWGGRIPMKFDWFLGRQLQVLWDEEIVTPTFNSRKPFVVRDLRIHGEERLSDHRPIGVDLKI